MECVVASPGPKMGSREAAGAELEGGGNFNSNGPIGRIRVRQGVRAGARRGIGVREGSSLDEGTEAGVILTLTLPSSGSVNAGNERKIEP
ncbi:hypothetical protein RUND412_010453 [Rhizina undulata]